MTPLAYAWTAVASSAPVATSTRTARPDSVPKSIPIAYFMTRGAVPAGRSTPPSHACGRSGGPGAPRRSRVTFASIARVSDGHRRDRLEGDRGLDGRRRCGPQANGPWERDEDRGRVRRAPTRRRQGLDDDPARLPFVVAGDLVGAGAPGSPAPSRGSSRRGSCRGRGSGDRPAPTPWRFGSGYGRCRRCREAAVQVAMGRRVGRRRSAPSTTRPSSRATTTMFAGCSSA